MDPALPDYGNLLGEIQRLFAATTPNLPPEAWWVAVLFLLVLGTASAIDCIKAVVPDKLIFFGMITLVGLQGLYVTWPFAAHQMTWGLVAAAIIWGINEIWYRFFKHDALGLGDAKWSMLAVTCFGGWPVLIAWGLGAILGTLWIGALKLSRRPIAHVHFAPFLFVGLVAGLWVLRFAGLGYFHPGL